MPIMDTSCMYSTVKNISGKTLPFSSLPPHGKNLADDEEYTIFGDIREAIARGPRGSSQQRINSFIKSLQDGQLAIQETPATIIYDADGGVDAPQMIQIDGGVISAIDPCWTGSV